MIKNLLICQTPFQLILGRAILGDRTDYEILIVLERNFNKNKIENYTRYFKEKKININYLMINNKGFGSIKSLMDILPYLKKRSMMKYDAIYFASIHNLYIHYILSFVSFNKLITFDDGTGNINKSGIFYINKSNFKNKIIRFIFGIKFDLNIIKSIIEYHYTIYRNIDNIVENCKYINIFKNEDNINTLENKNSTKISIFIGQPLENICTKINYNRVNDFINKKKVNFYYPHPREICNLQCNKVVTPLVAEEYILNLLRDNPNLCIDVYGFFSSVMFNIISVTRVNVFALYDESMKNKYSDLYCLIQSMGAELINFEDL